MRKVRYWAVFDASGWRRLGRYATQERAALKMVRDRRAALMLAVH